MTAAVTFRAFRLRFHTLVPIFISSITAFRLPATLRHMKNLANEELFSPTYNHRHVPVFDFRIALKAGADQFVHCFCQMYIHFSELNVQWWIVQILKCVRVGIFSVIQQAFTCIIILSGIVPCIIQPLFHGKVWSARVSALVENVIKIFFETCEAVGTA